MVTAMLPGLGLYAAVIAGLAGILLLIRRQAGGSGR